MHKAKAVIVSCMDFRFQKYVFKWLEENNLLGSTDIISIAGASRNLTTPTDEASKEFILKQIELSVSLHNPDTIYILDHQDCGGYALDGTIPANLEESIDYEHHKKFSVTVKSLLSLIYPNKEIITLYLALDGTVKKI